MIKLPINIDYSGKVVVVTGAGGGDSDDGDNINVIH